VLVVEDEEAQRRVISAKLTEAGFNVASASNGVEGLAAALELHPDLVLLDIVMPRMDGVTVLRELRKDPWGKTANVAMLTNLGEDARGDVVRSLGVTQYYVKTNWKLAEVIERISAQLGGR